MLHMSSTECVLSLMVFSSRRTDIARLLNIYYYTNTQCWWTCRSHAMLMNM